MARERWGTFSVKDHLMTRPFIADVLLYNRLVIPYPPDQEEKDRWTENNWQPDKLNKCLDILKDKAILVPWNQRIRDFYDERFTMAVDISEKQVKKHKGDPYYNSRLLLTTDFLPDKPDNVSMVWPMAAYPALEAYNNDHKETSNRENLAMLLSHQFLIPEDSHKSDAQLLHQAMKLCDRDDFQKKREEFYKWQDDIIEKQIPVNDAVKEMEDLLRQYEKVISKAKLKMIYKYAFLAIEVGLGLAGAKFGEPIATTAALAGISKFAIFDRKLEIDAGDCKGASMIHDFKSKFN